jgi:hypothetical protein
MIGVDVGCVSKAKKEKLMKIAVDIGYSSVKGVSEYGRVMFPSVVAPASEDLLVKSNIAHRVHLRRTLVDVEEHLVGDAAVMSALATSCLALREKPDVVHAVLLQMSFNGRQERPCRHGCTNRCWKESWPGNRKYLKGTGRTVGQVITSPLINSSRIALPLTEKRSLM